MTITICSGGTEYLKELYPHFENHWKEVGYDKRFGDFDLDLNAYEHLENYKMFMGVGAKDGDTPIAYMSVLIFYHPHCRGLKLAQTDAFYIKPEYRGLKGYTILCKMIREAESILKNQYNVKVLNISFPQSLKLNRLVERQGYSSLDTVMSKRL